MADLHHLVAAPVGYLADPDPKVRRLAVSACVGRLDAVAIDAIKKLLASDPDARVRAEAAEVIAGAGIDVMTDLAAASSDVEGVVREAVATAYGELAGNAEVTLAVPWLLAAAAGDPEKLVREAAVAALGAIGDERAVPLLLDLVASGPPQVRRRSVVALSVFDGPEIEAAIKDARQDRNPMVREAAEMVYGR